MDAGGIHKREHHHFAAIFGQQNVFTGTFRDGKFGRFARKRRHRERSRAQGREKRPGNERPGHCLCVLAVVFTADLWALVVAGSFSIRLITLRM